MAAATRLARSSIFPKRSCGAEEAATVEEGSSITFCDLHPVTCRPRGTHRVALSLTRHFDDRLSHAAASRLKYRYVLAVRATAQFLIGRHARCGRGCNRLDNLRRQSKAHVFRHDFDFLDIVESLRAQELDDFFDQTLRRRSSCSQCNGLHAFQPLWLNVLTTVD